MGVVLQETERKDYRELMKVSVQHHTLPLLLVHLTTETLKFFKMSGNVQLNRNKHRGKSKIYGTCIEKEKPFAHACKNQTFLSATYFKNRQKQNKTKNFSFSEIHTNLEVSSGTNSLTAGLICCQFCLTAGTCRNT